MEEKPLSESIKTFTLSNLGENQGETIKSTEEASPFQLNELIMETSSKARGFTYESETARNFDDLNVKKAKEGVKELFKDAVDKAKRQVLDIKKLAHKDGYNAGYAEGFKKGEDAAREEFKPFLDTLESLISDLTGFRKDMYDKTEREMIEMVVGLAKKVIHFEFSTRDSAVKEMIRLAVQSVLDRESMIIKINPADKAYADSFSPELFKLFSDIKNITFEPHSGVERGGCIVENNFGVIDARVDILGEQIDRILNLAPSLPGDLATEANLQVDIDSEETSEVSLNQQRETKESGPETSEDDQTQSDESNKETDPPEETT
jgi:flagellar assembly protein FliH